MPSKGHIRDLTGRTFGRGTVLRRSEHDYIRPDGKGREVRWELRCECGNVYLARRSQLFSEKIMSCGCLKRDKSAKRLRRHGQSETPEYIVWAGMIARCENPSHRSYADYGGRGIRVCAKWRESFPAFLTDMGKRPGSRYSVERIDNDGNYEPENCRWATDIEQANHRRGNRIIEHDGESLTLAEWSRKLGISYGVIQSRLDRGWPASRALLPGNQSREASAMVMLEFNGERMCASDWERRVGLGIGTIRHRLRRGWSVDRAIGTGK